MKKFVARIVLFFGIILIVDIIFGFIISYFQKRTTGDITHSDYHITKEVISPVLIMGSSRALHHYNPRIIGDSLGLETYNCGVDGYGILFQYGRLRLMLERYTPKIIIYDAITDFDIKEDNYAKYIGLLRRWYGEECLDSLFNDVDPYATVKLKSNLYRYNRDFIQILSANISLQKNYEYNGFSPLDGNSNLSPSYIPQIPVPWGDLKYKYFNKFITLCHSNNIKLIVVYSPWYNEDSSIIFDNLTKLCRSKGVPVIDMYADPKYENQDYFYDSPHLNRSGADIFSRDVASRIRTVLSGS